MAMIRWDPYEELLAMGERMDRFLGLSGGSPSRRWTPAMDVYESNDDIAIRLEVPGVRPDDVELSLDDYTLIIRGERHEEIRDEGSRHWAERRYGRFERQFALPRTSRLDEIDAVFEDGILEVTIPKQAQREPRRIDVRRAGQANAIAASPERPRLKPPGELAGERGREPERRPAAGRPGLGSPDDGWVAVAQDVPPAVPDEDLDVPLSGMVSGEMTDWDQALAACIAGGTYGSSIDTDDEEESCARQVDDAGAKATVGETGATAVAGQRLPASSSTEQPGGESSLEEMIADIQRAEAADRTPGEDAGSSGQAA